MIFLCLAKNFNKMQQTILVTLSYEELDALIESSLNKFLSKLNNQIVSADDDTLLDTKEASVLVKYKESSIYGLVKRRKIPFCKVEGKLLFSKKKLLEWVRNKQSGNNL
jgi:hypothetical protein